MKQQLATLDLLVIAAYLIGMLALGVSLSRKQRNDDEYFLAGRRMPWFAVGMSIIASLLSSLTYLSEPGEVWNSGITHSIGKLLAIPLEMAFVWLFCVPFLMRFRFTSAYEYLEHRFGLVARRLGVCLFILMVVLWMGFVVLASSRALAIVSGFGLLQVMMIVGVVATVYTVLGGLRAVIWTDVVQVVLLIGGGLFSILFVAWTTGTWLPDWYQAVTTHLAANETEPAKIFSLDPTVRATVVTVAINMAIWHICTHCANQMTVQRYFSTSDLQAARRSFVSGSLLGVGINFMLVVVGMAMLYYYTQTDATLGGLDPTQKQDRDLIFPMFSVRRLPPGCGGAIMAALFAAAMSSIDSGVNSIATVLTVERFRQSEGAESPKTPESHVAWARMVTLIAGILITVAACGLSYLPREWGIVDAMPRTFNAVTAPLGAMFLIGMFLPFCGQRAVLIGTASGLVVSVGLGYLSQISDAFVAAGVLQEALPGISFTWIMPMSLLSAGIMASIASLVFPKEKVSPGMTWFDPPPSE